MTLADCTVMVVEDHEFQRQTTLQMLANLGVGALLEAADGDSALALLADVDIVVCDLDMPGMDGVEFLRHVARTRPGTAIVIASGLDESVLASAELTAREFGLEVLGAIRKPLTARRLLQAVGLHGAEKPGPPAPAPGEPRTQVVIDLADGRPAALEVRGGTPAQALAAAGDLRLTFVVERPTEDLLQLDPNRVTISVLDGPGLSDRALLTRLRVHGFGLGVADFGAGRATLADLARLPLTEVQLAARIVQGGSPEALAATVEALKGVTIVGAGCDSKAEWLLLLELGCHRAQGSYTP